MNDAFGQMQNKVAQPILWLYFGVRMDRKLERVSQSAGRNLTTLGPSKYV